MPDPQQPAPRGPAAAAAHRALLLGATIATDEGFRRLVEQMGLETLCLKDMGQAFTLLGRAKVDLILTEPAVAGLPAVELLAFLRARGVSIPVLVLGADEDEALRAEARKSGAVRLLSRGASVGEIAASIQAALQQASQGPVPRVLIVDDDPLVRKILSVLIEDTGAAVQEADGAMSALQEIQLRPFNLVLLDLYMADYSGLSLLQSIRQLQLTIPVILLTGRPSEDVIQQARMMGALAVLPKSGDLRPLRDAVLQVLQAEGFTLKGAKQPGH